MEATLALFKGNQDEAKKLILKAIETDPTSPQNALILGEISYAIQDMESARSAFLESVKGRISVARGHYFLAKVAMDLGSTEEAKSYALQTLQVNPTHPKANFLLGDISVKERRYEEAQNYYRKAGQHALLSTKKFPAKVFYSLGQLLEVLKQRPDAHRSYLLAHYFDPKQSPDLESKVESLDRSPAKIKSVLSSQVMDKDQYFTRGATLLKQKEYDKAFLYLQAAHSLDPSDGSVLLKMGETLEEGAVYFGDFQRVIAFYERAIQESPSLAKAYINLGLLETEQYNLERGYQLLLQAKNLEPKNADSLVALGKHFYKRQDYNRALDEFIKASKIRQRDSEILYYAGKMRQLFSRDKREAMNLFEQSYKADPFNYDALVEWLRLKVVNYDKNFAIKFTNNLIRNEPKNAKYYWALGEVYAANKDYVKAIRFYHQALDLDNKDGKVRMSLAKALEETKQTDKAVAEYRLASTLDRKKVGGFYRATELLIQSKKFNEAEEVLGILLETSPRYPGALRYLSRVYRAQKKRKKAVQALKKEVKNNPRNAKFRIELAELYMEYEQFESAVKELTEIANLPAPSKAPEYIYDKIRGYLLLSRCYRSLGRYESAEGAVNLALAIDAEDPLLHRELGYVYVGLQRNKDAVREFRNYLKRSPAAYDSSSIRRLIDKLVIPE